MKRLKQLVETAKAAHNFRVAMDLGTAIEVVKQHEDMVKHFEIAVNYLADDVGVIHDSTDNFVEVIVDIRLRLQKLSAGYEQLRAAAIIVCNDFEVGDDSGGWNQLREVLKNDLR